MDTGSGTVNRYNEMVNMAFDGKETEERSNRLESTLWNQDKDRFNNDIYRL